jgi:uncharacterized Zn finger protein (UPF0148 family)
MRIECTGNTQRACDRCNAPFVANTLGKYCPGCRAQVTREIRRRSLEKAAIKKHDGTQPGAIVPCEICGLPFVGTAKRTACYVCRQKTRDEKRKQAAKQAAEAHKQAEAAPRQELPSRIPAPCRECIYCTPREDFETGMVCRAEAFTRCRPYRPGAVPLVRKKS